MAILYHTHPSFVRCIIPNEQKLPGNTKLQLDANVSIVNFHCMSEKFSNFHVVCNVQKWATLCHLRTERIYKFFAKQCSMNLAL